MSDRKNTEEVDVKKAKVMAVLGIILFVVSFCFLFWAAIMQEMGVSNEIITPIALIGFFGCDIIAIVLLVKAIPGLMVADIEKMDKKYEGNELTELHLMDKDVVLQKFLENKFKCTEDGYYRKKKFSFWKDSICYYVRMTDDIEVENAVRRETNHFDNIPKKGKNFCLCLFVYMDEVSEYEKKILKEMGKNCIISETVLNPRIAATAIVIVVDCSTSTGYFLDIGKGKSLSLYSHGCKMLKKLLG